MEDNESKLKLLLENMGREELLRLIQQSQAQVLTDSNDNRSPSGITLRVKLPGSDERKCVIQPDQLRKDNLEKMFGNQEISHLTADMNAFFPRDDGMFFVPDPSWVYDVQFVPRSSSMADATPKVARKKFTRDLVSKALMCSTATYKPDPLKYLESCSPRHSFTLLSISREDYECPFLIAESENELYVSFRGTVQWADIVADCKLLSNLEYEGKCHQGFFSRSAMFPTFTLLKEILYNKERRNVVLCGHSLGGAIAYLCALKLFLEHGGIGELHNDRLLVVTFGAPLVVDSAIQRQMTRFSLHQYFCNFVYQGDPVPRLLYLAETAINVGINIPNVQEILRGVVLLIFGTSSPLSQTAIDSFLYYTKIMAKSSVPEYVPIGFYCFLENKSDIPLSCKKWRRNFMISPEDIRQKLLANYTIGIDTIYQHRLSQYEAAFHQVEKLPILNELHQVVISKRFSPRFLEASVEITCEKKDRKTSIVISGTNLLFITEIWTTVLKDSLKFIFLIHTDERIVLEVASATAFSTKSSTIIEGKSVFGDLVRLGVPTNRVKEFGAQRADHDVFLDKLDSHVFSKAFLQAVIRILLLENNYEIRRKAVESDPTLQILDKLEESLFGSKHILSTTKAKCTQDVGKIHEILQAVDTRFKEFDSAMLSPLNLKISNTKKIWGLGAVIGGTLLVLSGAGAVVMLGAAAMSMGVGAGILGTVATAIGGTLMARVDKKQLDYNNLLQQLMNVLGKNPVEVHLRTHKMEESICDWLEEQSELDDKALVTANNVFREPAASANLESKKQLLKRLRAIQSYYKLKETLHQSLYIGFAGVHNAGKSTLIQKLWKFETSVAAIGGTKVIEPYSLDDNNRIIVVDFPGSTDINPDSANIFYDLSESVSTYVVVFKAGHIGWPEHNLLSAVKKNVLINNDHPCLLVCINHADRFPELIKNKDGRNISFDTRAQYATQLAIPVECVWLTSFEDNNKFSPTEGVLGVDEVRQKIIQMVSNYHHCSESVLDTLSNFGTERRDTLKLGSS